MCTQAQKSTVTLSALAESVGAQFRAHVALMATQPKSAAVEEYRRQIARYLEAVQTATGWKLVQMGEKAGGLAHSTILRGLKGENTMGFPALMALEAASRVPIPDSLRGAAIQAQQPTRAEPEIDPEVLRSVARQLEGKSGDEQKAIIAKMLKALSEAG